MKTAAEEILKKKVDELSQHSHYQPYKYWDSTINAAIIEAMEEYAKQFKYDPRFKNKVYKCLSLLGAQSDLLGSVGSWGETLPDEEVLDSLDCWIKETIKERN